MAFSKEEQQIIDWGTQNNKSKAEIADAVFRHRTGMPSRTKTTPAPQQPRFEMSDITSTVSGLVDQTGQTISQIQDVVQNPSLRGVVAAGGAIPGTAFSIAASPLLALGKSLLTQQEQQAVGQAVGGAIQSTGIPEFMSTLSPETQRDVSLGSGYLDMLGMGLVSSGMGRLKSLLTPTKVTRTIDDVATQITKSAPKTDTISLNVQEKLIGMTPDVKRRLQDMGPEKLDEYINAVNTRNQFDTAPTAYEVGSMNVQKAVDVLESKISETGGDIGTVRQKLATVQAPIDAVTEIENLFTKELDKLNLTVKNGVITQPSNVVSKVGSANDIKVLQSLLDDFKVVKQSPTLENLIDLRMGFDSKIKFAKSASEVSNSVDPLSRQMRSVIAKKAEDIVGPSAAADLKKYSDFMDAYGDLRSFTDRQAGGEYLLRLVLSGRGGEARRLIQTIKEYTGVDLMDDATAMKVTTDLLANENQKNLFRQEISKAGYDVANILSSGPVGWTNIAVQKLIDYGVDPETVLKATAAGMTGYLLMVHSDEDGTVFPAGLAVLAAMPQKSRTEAIQQAAKLGKKIKLPLNEKDAVLNRLMKTDTRTTVTTGRLGGESVDVDDWGRLEELKVKAEKPKGLAESEYVEAKSILDKYDSFKKGEIPSTNLLEEAKKYKSAEEFVKAQGTLVYRGETPDGSSTGLKILPDAKFTTTAKDVAQGYAGDKGVVREFVVSPNAKLFETTPVDIQKWLRKKERELFPLAEEESMHSLARRGELNLDEITKKNIRVEKEAKKAYGEWLKSQGFDGYKVTREKGDEIAILNENVLIPRTQLEDIWKEANKADTPSTNLLEEAKKYKSAEEFVRAQGTPVYHGTNSVAASQIDEIGFKLPEIPRQGDALGRGVYLTNNKSAADSFANRRDSGSPYKGRTFDVYIDPSAKIKRAEGESFFRNDPDVLDENGIFSPEKLTQKYQDLGFDGIEVDRFDGTKEIVIFDPTMVRTRKQLEELWENNQKR